MYKEKKKRMNIRNLNQLLIESQINDGHIEQDLSTILAKLNGRSNINALNSYLKDWYISKGKELLYLLRAFNYDLEVKFKKSTPTFAQVDVSVKLQVSAQPRILNPGIKFFEKSYNLAFLSAESIFVPPFTTEITIKAVAEFPGQKYNISAYQLYCGNSQSRDVGIVSITNPMPATGGSG